MKQLLNCSVFCLSTLISWSQVEHIRIERNINPLVPSISGVYTGDIYYYQLCDSMGLQSALDFKIDSFKIEYSGKEYEIKGAVIPDSICVYIGACKSNQQIFLRDIYASNSKSQRIKLYSMILNVIYEKEDN